MQAKENSRQKCNGTTHSDESDSLTCRSFRVRSILEKSFNNELLPVMFHSPPPKPPRRRNSGQRVVTPTGCSSPKNCSEMAEDSSPPQSASVPGDNSLLLEEVKVLREMNDQLWKHLCSTQSRLDQLQNANLPSESENSLSSPSFAELLTSIYYAQKEKEELIEARLQVALNERDAAVRELEELVEMLGRNFKETTSNGGVEDISDKTIKELLKEVETTQDPAKLMQHHNMLLTHLYHEKKGKLGGVPSDLQLALVEKNALTMVKQLEEELHHWKHSSDGWHRDTKQWEASLLDILCQVISQRDSAYQKVSKLQEELKSLHHFFRQQKPSSNVQLSPSYEGIQAQELISQCQGNCKIHCASSEVTSCDDSGDTGKVVNYNVSEKLPSDVDGLKAEMLTLNQTLQSETKARQIAEESCRRLERLVGVLRKKVNGLHVGVQV